MNNPKEDPIVRRQMAVAAAPYIHPKAGEAGKKEEKNEKASMASKGKFAAGRSPLALVK
jgi:phage terminase small subunit